MPLTTTYTYPLSAFITILAPLLVGIYLNQKYRLTWKLFLYGAAAFILAQLAFLPLKLVLEKFIAPLAPGGNLLAQAIVFSFLIAITEQPASYSVLNGKLSWARSWEESLMFGAGFGGLESMIVGINILGRFISMSALLKNPNQLMQLPLEQQNSIQQQLEYFWSVSWYVSLMPALERIFALIIQIALAVVVMQVFLRGNRRWLWYAIGWHWLVNAVSRWSLIHFQDTFITVSIVGVFALTSLTIIFYFRPIEEEPES